MKRVLIVNDCKFESIVIKDQLLDMGYSAETTTEDDALVRVREFSPDVIIANLIMKNTTGDKLIAKIKSKNPDIVCILSSCDSIKREDYHKNNVDEIIHTPINKSQLLDIMERTLLEQEKQNLDRNNIEYIFKSLESKSDKKGSFHVSNQTSSQYKFSFCPFCGGKLDEIKRKFLFCPYCGQKLEV